jgi:DNA invertase Pin-like site-specific DNA recombinase
MARHPPTTRAVRRGGADVAGQLVVASTASLWHCRFATLKGAMRVVGYVRVSTEEQALSGVSLDAQRQQITGYSMMKGWQVAEFFVERGVSGSVPLAERPEGRRMLGTVTAGDVIITSRLDRAFRSAADALGTLEELKDQSIGLHMIDLGGDVCGNGISKLVFTILSAVAENERDRIRERIREVKRHLASQGVYGGGKRPFGWDVVDGRLVPNGDEQAALKRMKAMHRKGSTYREIGGRFGKDPKTIQRIIARAQQAQPA